MYHLLDTLFEAAVVLNPTGEIEYFNHHFSTLSKSSPRQIQKFKFLPKIIGIDPKELSRMMEAATKGNAPQLSGELNLSIKHNESESFISVVKVTPLDNKKFLVLFHDLTIENRLYEKYKLQLKELEQNHNQILQADKLSTIGEMTANVSHEISNPLTVASGTLEVIEALIEDDLEDIDKGTLESCVEDIKDAHQRIKNIMTNMKSFLHQSQAHREYTDLSETINKTLQFISPRLNDQGIKVTFHRPQTEVIGLVDPNQLEQVFINLIKNSIDSFSGKPGHIEIKITKDNNQHLIDFIDNGPGIREEIADKIFNAFFTTKKVGEGTGLGLAICQKIVSSHKGEILALPYDKGAHFQIRLPSIEVMSYTQNEFHVARNIEQGIKRILVVDDEVKILNILNTFISDEGIVFIGSANPEDALHVVEQVQLDLIVVDYHMPAMSGSEFAKKVRANNCDTPILYMSTQETQDEFIKDQAQLKLSGMITKPFTKDSVMAAILDGLKGEDK